MGTFTSSRAPVWAFFFVVVALINLISSSRMIFSFYDIQATIKSGDSPPPSILDDGLYQQQKQHRFYNGTKLFQSRKSNESDDGQSIPRMIEQSWIDQYERGEKELRDIETIRKWLKEQTTEKYNEIVKKGSTLGSSKIPSLRNSSASSNATKSDVGKNATESVKSANNTQEYFCQQSLFAGNSNKLLSLARGLSWARQMNLPFALLEDGDWYRSFHDPNTDIYLASPGEELNCKIIVPGQKAYYRGFSRRLNNGKSRYDYITAIARDLLPKKATRDRAEAIVRETYGNKPYMSVHRRAKMKCKKRSAQGNHVAGGANCSSDTMLEMCSITHDVVQQKYNPTK